MAAFTEKEMEEAKDAMLQIATDAERNAKQGKTQLATYQMVGVQLNATLMLISLMADRLDTINENIITISNEVRNIRERH